MRTLKLSLLVIAAAILALLMAAACGGDDENGVDENGPAENGTAEVELPPPGELSFAVTGVMQVRISEDLVSAAPVTAQGQDTQTVNLTGDATINFETGEFNIPQFGISGTVTVGGEDREIQVNQNPETPSTGETTADETKLDLFLEIELSNADTIVARNEEPVRLQADGPFVVGPPPFILGTPDGDPPIPLYDHDGTPVEIVNMGLWLLPLERVTQPDEVDGEPALSPEEEAFRLVVGPFGMTPEQFFQLRESGPSDPVQDLIYSISGTGPGLTGAQHDIVRIFAGIFDMTQQASQTAFGNTVFPCDTLVDGTRTVCPAGAGPVPPGELVMLAMVLDGEVPMEDPDHFYIYAAVFDADGDPANNFQFIEPYNWDYFQGTDRWYQLDWDPQVGQWQVLVSSVVDQVPQDVASNARVVIDGRVIVFFIPADEFGIARPGYRLTAFGHDGTFAPEVSGGDVTGADPTEPLLELPEGAIVIEEVEDVSATDGDGMVPVEPPETTTN
jgi:hypothetical protein